MKDKGATQEQIPEGVEVSDGLAESEPATFKVIDRRGAPKLDKPRTPPDFLSEIRDTEDRYVFIAVFPGNREREQRFRVSRLESEGFRLLATRAKGLGPDGEKAAHAAQMKVLKVIKRAMEVHEARPPARRGARPPYCNPDPDRAGLM